MKKIDEILNSLIDYFTSSRRQERSVLVFIKLLIGFTIIKVVTLWSIAYVALPFQKLVLISPMAKLLFLPANLGQHNLTLFFSIVTAILVALLFIKPNYVTNLLLVWIVLNFFKLRYPVTNGSDYVLLVLSCYALPLSFAKFKNEVAEVLSIGMFNLFLMLAKIQIVLIYLISGWDKLNSEIWTSGEAFQYIPRISNIYNPMAGPGTVGETTAFLLSWTTILFELLFVVAVWKKRTRLWILCVGVIFHIVIWIMLSLPDFALMMMVSYVLFIEDGDLDFVVRRFKPLPR